MKIRSITYFCNPRWPLRGEVLEAAGEFLGKAAAAFEAAGYEVQTRRLATVPFPLLLGGGPSGSKRVTNLAATNDRISELPRLAQEIEGACHSAGIAYCSLGPALPQTPHSYEVIPEAIAASQTVFFGGVMAGHASGKASVAAIDLAAVRACAEIIRRCGSIEASGFANLRFAALANVPPGSPFFPAAYWERDKPGFAIATEAADLAVDAFRGQSTLEKGRRQLTADIEKHGTRIAGFARALSNGSRGKGAPPTFAGIDFSLAPFPAEARSLGAAFENLGVPKVGLHGSLAAAAILTEAIEHAKFPRAGFSGLMMPVLEDSRLARSAADGTLSVKDLLLYSAVCGTGLDTIPLPGDVTVDQIAALVLDVCALAQRLDKPLTARLMPIPGKKAGDPTAFDFGFFANSRVMQLEAEGLHGAFAGKESFSLRRR